MAIEWEISPEGQATRIDGTESTVVGRIEGETLTMEPGYGKYALPLRKKLKGNLINITKCINPDKIQTKKKATAPESIDTGLQDLNPTSLPEFYENKEALTPYEKRQRSRLIDKKCNSLPMTKAEKVAYESLQMGFWPYEKVGLSRTRPGMVNSGMVFKLNHRIAAVVVDQDDPYPSKENSPPGDIGYQYGNKNPRAADWVKRNLGQEEWDLLYTGIKFPVVDGSFKMGFDPNEADEMNKAGVKEIFLAPIG